MYLKLNDIDKKLVDELSALSGISKDVIREVWEYMIVYWAEQISRSPEKPHTLEIPFLGSLYVKYIGDEETPDGYLTTNVDAFISLSTQFKKLVGDIVDEKDSVVLDLLRTKIDQALGSLISSKG
jgi:hypothetical protein